jgi:hypothetical protein
MKLCISSSGPWPGRGFFKAKACPGVLIGMLVVLMPMSQVAAATPEQKPSSPQTATQKHHPRDNTLLKRQWGVELLFVRETSANYMLEFRYKVLDADKAKPLFERQTKPILTHVKTGAKLIVPTPAKTGALRNSNPPKSGKVYWMFFANPGKLVKPGDQVNIDIGDFHVKGLVVKQ